MEGNNYDLHDFFKEMDVLENIYNVLPFGNSFEEENDNLLFDMPNIDFITESFDNYKKLMDSDQIIQKLDKMEQSYSNMIHNNIISAPTISKNIPIMIDIKEKIAENFESNLILAEGTLPGLIISIMYKENSPVTHNYLLALVYAKFDDLRKPNGQKYNVFIILS